MSPGIAAAQDELEAPRRRLLLELVRDPEVTDVAKLEALARAVEAVRILDGDHAARITVVVEATQRIESTLAAQSESLAATQLYAMRAEATTRRLEARATVAAPPRWNGAVKAVFATLSAVALILAGGCANNPAPYIEAIDRWFR